MPEGSSGPLEWPIGTRRQTEGHRPVWPSAAVASEAGLTQTRHERRSRPRWLPGGGPWTKANMLAPRHQRHPPAGVRAIVDADSIAPASQRGQAGPRPAGKRRKARRRGRPTRGGPPCSRTDSTGPPPSFSPLPPPGVAGMRLWIGAARGDGRMDAFLLATAPASAAVGRPGGRTHWPALRNQARTSGPVSGLMAAATGAGVGLAVMPESLSCVPPARRWWGGPQTPRQRFAAHLAGRAPRISRAQWPWREKGSRFRQGPWPGRSCPLSAPVAVAVAPCFPPCRRHWITSTTFPKHGNAGASGHAHA
jgi:hypothetical protein